MIQKNEHSSKTILLVEDDVSHAEMLQYVLHSETPYKVIPFASGPDVLRCIEDVKQKKPDLFVFDYKLPHMNGLDLYDQIHAIAEFEDIPALVITASLSNEIEEAVAQRNIPLIYKPFEIDDLLDTIHSVLP